MNSVISLFFIITSLTFLSCAAGGGGDNTQDDEVSGSVSAGYNHSSSSANGDDSDSYLSDDLITDLSEDQQESSSDANEDETSTSPSAEFVAVDPDLPYISLPYDEPICWINSGATDMPPPCGECNACLNASACRLVAFTTQDRTLAWIPIDSDCPNNHRCSGMVYSPTQEREIGYSVCELIPGINMDDPSIW